MSAKGGSAYGGKNKNKKMPKKLFKIGELSRKVRVLPSTINFYTNEGLLKVSSRSQGGYRLYEEAYAINQIKKIQHLQFYKRLTIAEIKKIISQR